jgi:hypothetical protein
MDLYRRFWKRANSKSVAFAVDLVVLGIATTPNFLEK